MIKNIYTLSIAFFLAFPLLSRAQSFEFRSYIAVTDTIEEDGVIFAASTDDAEQINDEIDGLYDDDLDAGWEGAPEDQNIVSVGLRFRNIIIPQGAVIDSAFVIFYSHEGKSADDVARLTIAGEAADNAGTFTEDALISARPRTGNQQLWEIAEEWDLWKAYRTPDIKNVVQEIVSRNGWAAGNALALFLLGENQGVTDVENAREFESFENIADPEDGGDGQNHPERRPELVIYYSVDNARFEVPIAVTDTIEEDGVTFEASSDDAEQLNDEMDSLFDDDLDAGWEGAPEDQNIAIVGLRFRQVFIPKGAVIDSAFIQVWSHEGKSEDDLARITISAEASDNAETYTESALISARPRTTAKLLWEVTDEWDLWEKRQTPDLKDLVQEVVNRGGWATGNAIAFIMEGENQGVTDVENAREFESFENIADPEDGGDGQNHPERRPRLVIYYSSPSTAVSDLSGATARSLKVYPNPTRQGSINLELDSDDASIVRLYDLQGRLIKSMLSSRGKNLVFQTGNLPTGTYYIQALQGKDVYVQQVVIGQ
jgi:hypothetical protein